MTDAFSLHLAYYEELEDIMVVDQLLSAGVQDSLVIWRRERRGKN